MCKWKAKVTSTQDQWDSSFFFYSISSVDNSFLFSCILDNSFLRSCTYSLSPSYPRELASSFFQGLINYFSKFPSTISQHHPSASHNITEPAVAAAQRSNRNIVAVPIQRKAPFLPFLCYVLDQE